MGQVLLVRHGQAAAAGDDYDVLSPLGWEQARMLGAALAERGVEPGRVVVGGMRRHHETAEAVCDGGGWEELIFEIDPAWDEFDHAEILDLAPRPFEGDEPTREEFQTWVENATSRWLADSDPGCYRESFQQFRRRISGALGRAVGTRLRPGRPTVVITSGGPVATVTADLLMPSASCPELWLQLHRVAVNTSVTKLVAGPRGLSLVTFNEHTHLESFGNGIR